MRLSKKTFPSISMCCVQMLGSAPKSMDDIIGMCTAIGYTSFYMMVGVRATLGWHDLLSGSKCVFVSNEPFSASPGDKVHYSAVRQDKFGCIDQAFWVQGMLHYTGENLTVLSGKYDANAKRTVGNVVPMCHINLTHTVCS